MSTTPVITAVCPTYGRPLHLLQNTIAAFAAQTEKRSRLIILDDLGNLSGCTCDVPNVEIIVTRQRYASLPDKYNALLRYVDTPYLAVWEDDDLYLPWHLENLVIAYEAVPGAVWLHPAQVWSTYTGTPTKEPARGRFHAALSFRTHEARIFKGWPATRHETFDQILISSLERRWGPPVDHTSGYVFRWNDTLAIHGQHVMGGNGLDWYEKYTPQNREPIHHLEPQFDVSSQRILADKNVLRDHAVIG